MNRIDLVLVNPGNRARMYGALSESFAGIEPPIWTALLAAVVREQGYSVKIIDAEVEGWGPEQTVDAIRQYAPLLVGISAIGANPSASSTPKMPAVHQVLDWLRRQEIDSPTFLYGIHPSALPERTLQEEPVDFICRGECFETVPRLLKCIKFGEDSRNAGIDGLWHRQDGNIVGNGWGKQVEHLDILPFAAWDLLPMEKYRAHNWHCFGHLDRRSPYAVVYTSLGCPFRCTYCNIHALYGEKPGIRFRSPENVVAEIDLLVSKYGMKHIKFLDELFVLNKRRVMSICDLLIERQYDLNIWVYSRIDTIDAEMLRRMKQAGINWVAYGIEAGNTGVREEVIKGQFQENMIYQVVNLTHAAGIAIIGNFMFGLPEDTLETMQETLNMAKALRLEYVNFYTTMAYPGSKLYEEAVAQGLALPETWIGYAQFSEETLPLPTKHVSGAEVLRFRDQAFDEYYRDPEYLKMVEEKFGQETVAHIQQMLTHKIHRKFAA